MGDLHYREAEPDDVRLLQLLPAQGEPGSSADERMLAYLLGKHHPSQALSPRLMWMALDGEAPIGYIAGHLTRRFDCDGELQYLYVLPAYRGGAVAPALLRLLAGWFVGLGARRVCVNVGNDRAGRFYARHGARELEKHWMVWEDIEAVMAETPSRQRSPTNPR